MACGHDDGDDELSIHEGDEEDEDVEDARPGCCCLHLDGDL